MDDSQLVEAFLFLVPSSKSTTMSSSPTLELSDAVLRERLQEFMHPGESEKLILIDLEID